MSITLNICILTNDFHACQRKEAIQKCRILSFEGISCICILHGTLYLTKFFHRRKSYPHIFSSGDAYVILSKSIIGTIIIKNQF